MNTKERTVLFFLCFTFLIGVGVKLIRNYKEQKNLPAIIVKKAVDDTSTFATINDENDSMGSVSAININTATNIELEALPGIGPVLAQRIIEYRQKINGFKTKEELLKVSGIGPKKFSAIKDKIIVR